MGARWMWAVHREGGEKQTLARTHVRAYSPPIEASMEGHMPPKSQSPQSMGGTNRAKRLTKAERTAIAHQGAMARWSDRNPPVHQAIDEGQLTFGDLEFRAAVLNDENNSRVISGHEFMKVMGIYRSGALSKRRQSGSDDLYVPLFLAQKNLLPFILQDAELVEALRAPVLYRGKLSRSIGVGILGTVLRRICGVWVRAHQAGVLGRSQVKVAEKASVLLDRLADVAIIALIDEATGYQKRRARDELQKILKAYIAEELLPWAKRFPDSYYEHLYRVRGWEYKPQSNARTAYIGKLTNHLIYDKLPPGVLAELRQKNPVNPRTKRRKKTHHELLTSDVGHPHLQNQLNAVTTLLRASPDSDWEFFERLVKRAYPTPQRELFPDLGSEPDRQVVNHRQPSSGSLTEPAQGSGALGG